MKLHGKALSVQMPYAWAITSGYKLLENRDWKSWNPGLKFRGIAYIHAGKVELKDDVEWVVQQIAEQTCRPYASVMVEYRERCALGAVVGEAEFFDVITGPHPDPWRTGAPFAFLLRNVKRFDTPVPYRGALGFFQVTT